MDVNHCDACGAGAPGHDFLCAACERLLPSAHIEGLNAAAWAEDWDRLGLAQEIAAAYLIARRERAA